MPQAQLTMDERELITRMHAEGQKPAGIARRLGRHRATVGREMTRNADRFGGYHFSHAQEQARERRARANQRDKLATGPLSATVRLHLRQRWSPEQIAGRLRREHPRERAMHVSHETIYRWIYRESTQGQCWHQQLRRRRPRRRPRTVGQREDGRGRILGRVGIERRPAVVETRRRFGDWESDTIEGAKGSGLLVTHVERKSRYVRLGRLKDKSAIRLRRVSAAVLADLPAKLRRTMTVDNGKEFADFAAMQQSLNVAVYFANPHAPWERGANENTNGLLREFFPKGSDFGQITPWGLAKAQRMLNNRPRKCLNYRTPAEILSTLPGVALRN